jgi:hypothetical protein
VYKHWGKYGTAHNSGLPASLAYARFAQSKRSCEMIVNAYCQVYGFGASWIRQKRTTLAFGKPRNVIGKGWA